MRPYKGVPGSGADNTDLDKGGVKYDSDKPRWDLLPYDALDEVARVFTLGAAKYRDRNWEVGMRWGRPFAATLRHLSSWEQGETPDPETGLNHLSHAIAELLFLLAYELRGVGDDDRPEPGATDDKAPRLSRETEGTMSGNPDKPGGPARCTDWTRPWEKGSGSDPTVDWSGEAWAGSD